MAQPIKFLFEKNFDTDAQVDDEPETILLSDHEQALEDARRIAHAEGVAEGRRVAEQEAGAVFSKASPQLVRTITDHLETLDDAIHTHMDQAASLALAMARTLAPSLIAREPLAELSSTFEAGAAHLQSTPHLAIRVPETLEEPARDALETIAEQAGYAGRISVVPDASLSPGDFRIGWANGGLSRSIEALESAIEDTMKSYLDGRRAATLEVSHG
ncbi:MAG: hypothetical protein AAF638_06455 [Pseudomonadota bacterium]